MNCGLQLEMYFWGGSVVPSHVPVVQPGDSDSTKASVALVEVGLLTEDVNHDHDCIKPVCFWELNDEVHQDGIPVLVQNLGWMKLTMGKPLERLHPVARITGSDVLADVLGQLGPPVVLGDKLQHLEAASMSGNPRIVVLLHDPAMEVLILAHNDLAMKQKESIRDLPLG
jgi:hypothetical protein